MLDRSKAGYAINSRWARYPHRAAEVWWRGLHAKVQKLDKLQVWRVPSASSNALAQMAERSMQLQATIQDGALTLSGHSDSVHIELERWK